MKQRRIHPVLVTGATGRIGRVVVDQLLAARVPVRALTRRPTEAGLPPAVEIASGDLTVPESLDAALRGVGAVFLVWTVPPATAQAVDLTPGAAGRNDQLAGRKCHGLALPRWCL